MSNETTPATDTTNKSAEVELKAHEVPEVLDFVRENGMSVLVGVGLAVAVFLGFSAYRNYKAAAAQTASDMLFKAQGVEQIQQVLNQYGSTPTAPLAQLALASAQFDAGQYELADHAFSEFQQKYPTHTLAAQAELGRAQCKEATGQLNEAFDAFARFVAANPTHYLAPTAIFGKARCLEQMGRFSEARALCEDFIAASPTNDQWTARAETALLYLDKEARASKLPPPAAPKLDPIILNPAPAAPLPTPAPESLQP